MNFIAYIARQKNLISGRNGETVFEAESGNGLPFNGREKLLAELDNLKGLNTRECESASCRLAVEAQNAFAIEA